MRKSWSGGLGTGVRQEYFQGVNDEIRVPTAAEKRGLYAEAGWRIGGLVAGEPDRIARMAGIVAVLHGLLPHFYWTGFYRVSGAALVIGPYQGTPGCARIAWGKGVCGTAWASGQTQVVADVHAFPGHLACDARSASEIVVPGRDAQGRVVAVLDVDSLVAGAFDEIDREALEGIMADWGEGGTCGKRACS
ncbi:MAG: GAF domain-containing protein [Verrucomicrobia bacterium]|nr:GAF domain-containing protein [Verrucomicrobiota bacterium]